MNVCSIFFFASVFYFSSLSLCTFAILSFYYIKVKGGGGGRAKAPQPHPLRGACLYSLRASLDCTMHVCMEGLRHKKQWELDHEVFHYLLYKVSLFLHVLRNCYYFNPIKN